jgi:hypothetical protein
MLLIPPSLFEHMKLGYISIAFYKSLETQRALECIHWRHGISGVEEAKKFVIRCARLSPCVWGESRFVE